MTYSICWFKSNWKLMAKLERFNPSKWSKQQFNNLNVVYKDEWIKISKEFYEGFVKVYENIFEQ